MMSSYYEIKALHSKDIIDKIDYELANCYKLSEFETDFLIIYDIKFRMG